MRNFSFRYIVQSIVITTCITSALMGPSVAQTSSDTQRTFRTVTKTVINKKTLANGASYSTQNNRFTIGVLGGSVEATTPTVLSIQTANMQKLFRSSAKRLSPIYRYSFSKQSDVTGTLWISIKTKSAITTDRAVIKYWDADQKSWIALDSSVAGDHTIRTSMTGRDQAILAVFKKKKSSTKEPVVIEQTVDSTAMSGAASWYYSPYPGTAAMTALPRGSVVQVTNLDNGKTITTRVADYGPVIPGRIIDLDAHAFQELAPLSQGVMHNVRVVQVK